MSVPVVVCDARYVCVQDVVELLAAVAVWVYATDRGARSRTWVPWSDVGVGLGV